MCSKIDVIERVKKLVIMQELPRFAFIITGSLALRHVSHPNKTLSAHADKVTKHRSEKLKELTVDSSHS